MRENWPVKSDYNSKWVIGEWVEAKGMCGFDLKILKKFCSLGGGRFRSSRKNSFMGSMYTLTLYAQRIEGIIINSRKTVYINMYLYVSLALLKVKTEKNITNHCCHMPIHSPYLLCQFTVTSTSGLFLRQFCGFIS